MIKFNNIIKTETYIELDAEDGGKMFMPASATIFVDDNSGAISVKNTASRKTVGYVISGGTPPVPPTNEKWIATYDDGHTASAECDDTGTLTVRELPSITHITSIKINECVTIIGNNCFMDTYRLRNLVLPSSIIRIGDTAFDESEVEIITVLATTPPAMGVDVFIHTDLSLQTIYVPAESLDAYKAAPGWSRFAGIIQPIP